MVMLDPLFAVLALVGLVAMFFATVIAMVLGGGPEVLQTLMKAIIEIFKHLR